jgi:steroid delta-isomerase-like uncharacterized protein
MSSENKALARQWFEDVWNRGRDAAIDEMLSADAVVHGLGADLHGPAGFRSFHAAYRSAFPDVFVTIEHVVAEGDMVAAHWTGTGTHLGSGLGFAPTGKHVSFSGMVFMRVQGGKFVEGWNQFDQLGMLQQIGAVR